MPTVMLIDDHDLVRTGIKRLLASTQKIEVVAEANNGEDAVILARKLKPQVILLDLQMPGIGGMEAIRRLLHINPAAKIIILTSCQEICVAHHMLKMGVAGYLTKNTNFDEIVKAIFRIHAGQQYISPDIAQQLALINNTKTAPSLMQLSEREMQIMLMLTRKRSVDDIADKLCISKKTVNTHRYRLFEKLDITNDVELVHLASHFGLLEKTPSLSYP